MDIEKELEKLEEQFEKLFDEVIDILELNGRTLKEALVTQLPMQVQVEVLVRHLCYLYDEAEVEVESAYSKAVKDQMHDSYRDVNISEAKIYAKADPVYKDYCRLLNKVRKVRDEARGTLDIVNSRKYTCNNLTNSIVAGVDSTIL